MAYSATTDLLTAKIPTPDYLDLTKVVQDASDEIDSKIGYRYDTPINVTESGPLSRPARLLLKRINNSLASGRLILQIASPEEHSSLHAYGWSLVRESLAAINAIADGDILLEGATLLPSTVETGPSPVIANLDSESNVEAFYNRLANPNYVYTALDRYSNPDRFVD